jgi:hypothetical protein
MSHPAIHQSVRTADPTSLQDLRYGVDENGAALPEVDIDSESTTALNNRWNAEAYDRLVSKL